MNGRQNEKLTAYAQELRKKMTEEERHLWYDFLKDLPVTVRRQKVFGAYIVDFYIASVQLVIELDGSQQYDPAYQQKDAERDRYLQSQGLTVLRYSNADIHERFEGVCEDILLHLSEAHIERLPPPGEAVGEAD